jgi:hypothetical protein
MAFNKGTSLHDVLYKAEPTKPLKQTPPNEARRSLSRRRIKREREVRK